MVQHIRAEAIGRGHGCTRHDAHDEDRTGITAIEGQQYGAGISSLEQRRRGACGGEEELVLSGVGRQVEVIRLLAIGRRRSQQGARERVFVDVDLGSAVEQVDHAKSEQVAGG